MKRIHANYSTTLIVTEQTQEIYSFLWYRIMCNNERTLLGVWLEEMNGWLKKICLYQYISNNVLRFIYELKRYIDSSPGSFCNIQWIFILTDTTIALIKRPLVETFDVSSSPNLSTLKSKTRQEHTTVSSIIKKKCSV